MFCCWENRGFVLSLTSGAAGWEQEPSQASRFCSSRCILLVTPACEKSGQPFEIAVCKSFENNVTTGITLNYISLLSYEIYLFVCLFVMNRLRISIPGEFSCLLYLWVASIWRCLRTTLAASRFRGSTAVRGCILMENYSRPSSSKQAGRKFRSLTSVMVRWVASDGPSRLPALQKRSVRLVCQLFTSRVISLLLKGISDVKGW